MTTFVRRPDPVAVVVALDRSGSTPLAVQLTVALRIAAMEGRLKHGDRLPSSRTLAERLGVSRAVTTAAYEQLHGEGWLNTRHGAGTFVVAAPLPPHPVPRKSAPLAARGGPAPTRVGSIPTVASLVPGLPLHDVLDRAAWRRAWRAAGDRLPSTHRLAIGEPGFRVVVAETFLRHRGMNVAEPLADDGVIATGGTAAALVEVVSAVLRPGARVAIEAPGWPRAWRIFQDAGMTTVPIPVDDRGLLPDAIPHDVDAVYTTPAHQFPLGALLPAERRLNLIDLAQRHNWLIIEDDYDGELGADIAPPPLLATLDPSRVVHLGSMSKIISPLLSCGWMLAPSSICTQVIERRVRTSPPLSPTGQWVVEELAALGDLARHVRRLRRELLARRSLVQELLLAEGIPASGGHAGGHIYIPFASQGSAEKAWRALRVVGLELELVIPTEPLHNSSGLTLGLTGGTRKSFVKQMKLVATILSDLDVR